MRKDGNREERPLRSKFLWTAHFPFVHIGTGEGKIPTFLMYSSANGRYFLSKLACLIKTPGELSHAFSYSF